MYRRGYGRVRRAVTIGGIDMAIRLAVLVLAFAMIACALLALRQARLQAAHELAVAQRRVQDTETALWRVHADIAERLTPERIERLIAAGAMGEGVLRRGVVADPETIANDALVPGFGPVTLWEFDANTVLIDPNTSVRRAVTDAGE